MLPPLGLLAGAAVLGLVVTVALVLRANARQAARIADLEGATRRLGAGDPDARARELPGDEIGRLGRSINQMAVELRARLDALERQRDEAEQILAHMSDGVALLDEHGRVLHANRGIAGILGLPLPPAPGESIEDVARWPALHDLLQAAGEHEHAQEADLRLWTPEPRLVRATVSRLHGTARGSILLVLHDLTEAERLNRVRQDFVANVSHELKTPLTSVRGYAETLLEGGLDDHEHREGFVRIIRDQATRLQTLVEDLLSLAELERPDARLRAERFDLRDLVERHVGQMRDRAERAGLALSCVPGPPEEIVADRRLVEQVVANLLDNALKYTERGVVEVALGGDAAHVWCEVRDSGPGIPDEEQPRIFERFYRVDKARSREKGGTGLGLAIVKHVVDLHGGAVRVESAPGAGTTFRFELPRDAGATQRTH